jgi:CheY-like chemotaxis protein
MVHGIMRQHDGWVECRSEVGVGTRFDLYLPRRSDGPQVRLAQAVSWSVAAAPLSATPPPSDRSITILIVDDEEMIRSLGRAVLESAGYRVLEASDGEDAVELFRVAHADIDLVILDLTMPRMSGQDAFRELAAADPGVRVLLSSGYTPDGLADTVGILGLLPKPYRPAELLDAVRVALNLSPTPEWAAANH